MSEIERAAEWETNTLRNAVNSQAMPRVDRALRLARVLNLSVEELFDESVDIAVDGESDDGTPAPGSLKVLVGQLQDIVARLETRAEADGETEIRTLARRDVTPAPRRPRKPATSRSPARKTRARRKA